MCGADDCTSCHPENDGRPMCEHRYRSGRYCSSFAADGSKFCDQHDPVEIAAGIADQKYDETRDDRMMRGR